MPTERLACDRQGNGAGSTASGRPRPLMWLMLVLRREGVGLLMDTRRQRIYPVPVPLDGEIAERIAAIP